MMHSSQSGQYCRKITANKEANSFTTPSPLEFSNLKPFRCAAGNVFSPQGTKHGLTGMTVCEQRRWPNTFLIPSSTCSAVLSFLPRQLYNHSDLDSPGTRDPHEGQQITAAQFDLALPKVHIEKWHLLPLCFVFQ